MFYNIHKKIKQSKKKITIFRLQIVILQENSFKKDKIILFYLKIIYF